MQSREGGKQQQRENADIAVTLVTSQMIDEQHSDRDMHAPIKPAPGADQAADEGSPDGGDGNESEMEESSSEPAAVQAVTPGCAAAMDAVDGPSFANLRLPLLAVSRAKQTCKTRDLRASRGRELENAVLAHAAVPKGGLLQVMRPTAA
jgi:hypothetical protein